MSTMRGNFVLGDELVASCLSVVQGLSSVE